MDIDCVFSGGGIKGYAFIGALQTIKEHQYEIKRVAGTSAGAILAACIAANYTVEEIEQMLEQVQIENLLDPPFLSKYVPFTKWFLLYRQMGLYKGDKLESWFEDILAKKGVYTFADLEKDALKIVISDISLGKLVVIPDDLQRVYGINPKRFKVATAVRMSANFPYFFMPKKLYFNHTYSYIVDGGILSNFPLWVFRNGEHERDKRPVLGITLSDTVENSGPVKVQQAIDLFRALFLAMMRAHDTRYVSRKMQNDVIFIPVKEINAMDLAIPDDVKRQLIQLGNEKTATFLKTWSK